MKIFVLLIASVLLMNVLSQECGTALDRYIQGLQLLKIDREEMRNTVQKLQKIVDENKLEYLAELQKLKIDHENKIKELVAKEQNDINNLSIQINEIRAYSQNLQNQLNVFSSDLNSIHRSAGMYQIDDCGKDNIQNPYTGTFGFMVN